MALTAKYIQYQQCSIGKKITIPCEPNAAHKAEGNPYFCYTCPCTYDTVYARLEDFRTFLCIFMSIVKIFVC